MPLNFPARGPATGGDSDRRVVEIRDREHRDKDKERESHAGKAGRGAEDKSRLKPVPSKATVSAARAVPKAATGLSEEVLTQVAQAKFEAQEEKLKDVARHSMALLRDHGKLNQQQFHGKIREIRKALVKYESQSVRVWDLQERVRNAEIGHLAEEIERCRTEAEEEGSTIDQLRGILDKERRRRKRYDGYEVMATEVNKKKTRLEYRAEIDRVTNEIKVIKTAEGDLEEMIEMRNRSTQLLQHVVHELKDDAQKEQSRAVELLAKMGKPNPKVVGGRAPIAEPDEVIS